MGVVIWLPVLGATGTKARTSNSTTVGSGCPPALYCLFCRIAGTISLSQVPTEQASSSSSSLVLRVAVQPPIAPQCRSASPHGHGCAHGPGPWPPAVCGTNTLPGQYYKVAPRRGQPQACCFKGHVVFKGHEAPSQVVVEVHFISFHFISSSVRLGPEPASG
jgi:hypothetical protein